MTEDQYNDFVAELCEARPWSITSHTATVQWTRDGQDFLDRRYSRGHALALRWRRRGARLLGALGRAAAALGRGRRRSRGGLRGGSCRAATCCSSSISPLAPASVVDRYEDRPWASWARIAAGKSFVARVVLRPALTISGDKRPDDRRARRAAPQGPRVLLHRQFRADRGRGRARHRPVRLTVRVRRNDALPAPLRCRPRRHARAHRRRRHRRPVRRHSCRRPRHGARDAAGSAATAGELEVERILGRLAGRNVPASSVPFFVGAGAYKHHVPATVDHLIQRSEFLTSYTPYQPEIAQGTLQYLFEFQTQVAALTGMEVANASMYDGSTGLRRGRADGAPRHPAQARPCSPAACIRTTPRWCARSRAWRATRSSTLRARRAGARRTCWPRSTTTSPASSCRRPTCSAICATSRPSPRSATPTGALLIAVFTEAVSLGLVASPGAMGADIVVGEGQSIGNALSSSAGPMSACSRPASKYVRQMPGRLCGETVDADGQRGFVLTLSTREQHIRRDKATSNICTNSGLCCLAFTIHMTLLGQAGLAPSGPHQPRQRREARRRAGRRAGRRGAQRQLLQRVHRAAARAPRPRSSRRWPQRGVLAGVPVSRLLPGAGLDDLLLVATTEVNTDEDRAALVAGLQEVL